MVSESFRADVAVAIAESGAVVTPRFIAKGEREAAFLPEISMAFVSFRGGTPELIPAATAAGLMDSYPDGKPKQPLGEAIKESGKSSLIYGGLAALLIILAAYLTRL